jgi:hypothetical protein
MPEYGKCVAAKVLKEYDWDSGIPVHYGVDFGNFYKIDIDSLITFNRRDPNIVPSVNLEPRRRVQIIHQKADFLKSMENLKEGNFDRVKHQDRGVAHLQNKTEMVLAQLTRVVQQMNKSKELEKFLHRVFERVPNCTSVTNGFGWKTDHGADLIVDFENPLVGINLSHKLIVQVKSYENEIADRNAIDQIIEGINVYQADGGLLFTTAKMTEDLENYIVEQAEDHNTTIDVIAGNDVARFILRYAPDLILGND